MHLAKLQEKEERLRQIRSVHQKSAFFKVWRGGSEWVSERGSLKDGQRRIDFVLVWESKGAAAADEERLCQARRQDFENHLIAQGSTSTFPSPPLPLPLPLRTPNVSGPGLELEYDKPDKADILRLGCVKIHAPWEILCRSAAAPLLLRQLD